MNDDFTQLLDLASERLGGAVLGANDEFFAPKENLLKAAKPVFIADKYTDRGKWMDGWETRRRRGLGDHDWCIVRLGVPGVLSGAVVDTSYFTGNYPEGCSLEGWSGGEPDENTSWIELLPKTALRGDTQNRFSLTCPFRLTHVRLKIFPDGGVARLRLYGEPLRPPRPGPMDLAAAAHGGRVCASSDGFFGAPKNLLWPGASQGMHDGWETRRRRGPGHDWVVLRLATEGTVSRIEVDTAYFKGNYPQSCLVESCREDGSVIQEILPQSSLGPDAQFVFEPELRVHAPCRHIVFRIFPDGGVARLRVIGTPSREGLRQCGLAWLNALTPEEARRALEKCCASSVWAEKVVGKRPFRDFDQLQGVAETIWRNLSPSDWNEAFAAHPRIGQKETSGWAAQEQKSLQQAQTSVLAALEQENRLYEERFGRLFLVSAQGKSSEEMLALLRRRLENDAATELENAAQEQQKITALRVDKLLTGDRS